MSKITNMEKFEMVYSEMSKIIRLLMVTMGIFFVFISFSVISVIWISDEIGSFMGIMAFFGSPIYLIYHLIYTTAVRCIVTISENGLHVELESENQVYPDKNMHYSWAEVQHIEQKKAKGSYFFSVHTQKRNFNLNFRKGLQVVEDKSLLNAVQKYKNLN